MGYKLKIIQEPLRDLKEQEVQLKAEALIEITYLQNNLQKGKDIIEV